MDHVASISHFSVKEDKLQNQSILRISGKARVCDFGQTVKITKTS